jgi:hypothetical protein
MNMERFKNARLSGGFVIAAIEFTDIPFVDAIGREAIAKTGIVGTTFDVMIRSGLDERELSVTVYHEILEAASVASLEPPEQLIDFIEEDFERSAYTMHDRFGEASPENLNRMLQLYGFREL